MSARCWLISAFLLSVPLALAQTPTPPVRFMNPWVTVSQPNIPADPLEIVTNAEPVQDLTQRATAIKLLSNAQFLSNVRRGPYDLKTHFTSAQGVWQIEDSSPGRNIYRWAVHGPSYSAVNLFLDRIIYSDQTATAIPLRVAQVHSAIFAHFAPYGPRSTLRLANGNLNGTAVTCVLSSGFSNSKPAGGPRRWDEYESCIDPQSGLLMSYSPVPGIYVLYDYANAKHLGTITFPGRFVITEAGQTVIEAQVDSLSAPANPDAAIYTAAGLNALGVGFPLTAPWRMQEIQYEGRPNPNGGGSGQVVVVRGMVTPDGTLQDAEVLASSNPGLNQKALERAAQRHRMPQDDQNGATPQSHEAFFTTLFVTN